MSPRRTWAAVALVAVTCAGSPAVAQAGSPDQVLDPEEQVEAARRAFASATEAYEAGQYEAALAGFRRAYRLTGTPEVLYNVARAADQLDLDQEALEAYEHYLELRPDTEDRAHVEDRILSLRAVLSSDAPRREPPRAQAESGAESAPAPEPTPEPETRSPTPPSPTPPGPEEGPGPGPWILTGGGVAVAAGSTVLYLLTDSIVGLIGAGVGGAMVVGGVLWAVSF